MPWRDLAKFADPRVPKLDHLRRAAGAGLRVPATAWMPAGEVPGAGEAPRPPFAAPWMVRSASPEEDRDGGSAAGRFHSELVPTEAGEAGLGDAMRRVVASFGEGRDGAAVFVQPFVPAERAGIAFFDGFHYERTWTPDDNHALTAGTERGEVEAGTLERREPWSRWLADVASVFPALDRLDLEWAETRRGEYVLLQARRALFPVRRDPLVSIANHREILGEAPSPWIVSALDRAGRAAFDVFAACDPAIAEWGERYARVAAGRAWMDFSAFFRVMDHWGLPRTFVTQGVGGISPGPGDGDLLLDRFLRSGPRLLRLQFGNLRIVTGMFRELSALQRTVDGARDLADLHAATVEGLVVALRVNFALGGALAGVQRLRRFLRMGDAAQVVTGAMGRAYETIRRLPAEEREPALDDWLRRFGHRGPLESDPMHPRFHELRPRLLADLAGPAPPPAPEAPRAGRGPLYWFEGRRETFRHELMRVWDELRRRILAEARRRVGAGELEREEDVFFLEPEHLDPAGNADPKQDVADSRSRWEATRDLVLPGTARLSEVEEAARRGSDRSVVDDADDDAEAWEGIGLGGTSVEGRVVRASDLTTLLGPDGPGPGDVLVAPALEPAWGVLFGRVAGVVAEIGGELSHASILLRELGTPAVVNCSGVWTALQDGERIAVDPGTGSVRRVPRQSGQGEER